MALLPNTGGRESTLPGQHKAGTLWRPQPLSPAQQHLLLQRSHTAGATGTDATRNQRPERRPSQQGTMVLTRGCHCSLGADKTTRWWQEGAVASLWDRKGSPSDPLSLPPALALGQS